MMSTILPSSDAPKLKINAALGFGSLALVFGLVAAVLFGRNKNANSEDNEE